jgi:hypothetical protein
MRWIGVRWVIPAVARAQHPRAVRTSAVVLAIFALGGLAAILMNDSEYYNANSSSNPQLNVAVGATWLGAIFSTSFLLAALWSKIGRFRLQFSLAYLLVADSGPLPLFSCLPQGAPPCLVHQPRKGRGSHSSASPESCKSRASPSGGVGSPDRTRLRGGRSGRWTRL